MLAEVTSAEISEWQSYFSLKAEREKEATKNEEMAADAKAKAKKNNR